MKITRHDLDLPAIIGCPSSAQAWWLCSFLQKPRKAGLLELLAGRR